MKKIILTLAAVSLFAAAPVHAEDLSVTSTVAFESEYVFRGIQYAQYNFQPTVDLGYRDSYLGIWAMEPTDSADSPVSEINFYAGHQAQVDDMLGMDFGMNFYYFRNHEEMVAASDAAFAAGDPIRVRSLNSTEIEMYVGATIDVPLTPSAYLYYNFDAKVWTLEASGGRAFVIADGWDLTLGGHVGHAWAAHPVADYLYGGVSADLTYAFTPNANVSFGPRLTFNDSDADDPEMAAIEVSTNLWWGVSFTAGF